MNLGLYVWKEWRDQRAGLARLAAVLVLLALCALLLPEPVTGDPLFVSVFTCVALAAFALSVGSDLLAGELARDRVRFLERQPGGLAAAFAGKLVLFACGAGAVCLLGVVLAIGVALVRTGESPPWYAQMGLLDTLVLCCAAALAWTLAASTWVPRSALALPISLMLVALLVWPVSLHFGLAPLARGMAGLVVRAAKGLNRGNALARRSAAKRRRIMERPKAAFRERSFATCRSSGREVRERRRSALFRLPSLREASSHAAGP